MNSFCIEPYRKTGEFTATVEFTKKEVDWNVLHNLISSGCHCVWVESDLESYIQVYGMEEHCVHSTCSSVVDYLETLGGTNE